MLNSFFGKNKNSDNKNELTKGLVKENPLLMYSIASGYVFLDSLCSVADGLTYQRIGPVALPVFPHPVDHYIFYLNEKEFCDIFIYAYHKENEIIIPEPFKKLNQNINEGIFKLNHSGYYRYLMATVELVLTKRGILFYPEDIWSHEKEYVLNKLLKDMGYEDELEKLIYDQYQLEITASPQITKNGFAQLFAMGFHNKLLASYAPDYIQERNKDFLSAYDYIIETINRIQAWQDHELVRKRIEIDTFNSKHYNLGYFDIKKCVTPFCVISLGCDMFGRYNISYGIDSQIQEMISDNMSSTLIRRIYEFTSGTMEPFVRFTSLNMDCISYFHHFLKNVHFENYNLVVVKRHEEKSISDMLRNLTPSDNIDPITKKWLNR